MRTEDQLYANVVAALYLLATVVMLMLCIQNYRYGLFDLVYSASLMLAMFASIGAYARFAPEASHLQKASLWVLGISFLIVAKDSLSYPLQVQHWAYPLGLLSFIALSHRQAITLNSAFATSLALVLFWQQGFLEALTFTATFVLIIALASSYAQLHQRRNRTLVELGIRDPITGAYNYRHLEDTLGKEICRADRTGKPLSLITLEIDYFPQVQDLHGTVNTNDLVKQFSETLGRMIRAGDSQYCDSNHTFYLLLPCTPSEGVLVIAERIRRTIEERTWPIVDSTTVSLGCTSYLSGTREVNVNSLINDANIALFEAQKNGHNRVCHHGY